MRLKRPRKTIYRRRPTQFDRRDDMIRQVRKAYDAKSRSYRLLGRYGNGNSAQAISWMARHGKRLKAFEAYPPGTFETQLRFKADVVEVWFRRA